MSPLIAKLTALENPSRFLHHESSVRSPHRGSIPRPLIPLFVLSPTKLVPGYESWFLDGFGRASANKNIDCPEPRGQRNHFIWRDDPETSRTNVFEGRGPSNQSFTGYKGFNSFGTHCVWLLFVRRTSPRFASNLISGSLVNETTLFFVP